MKKHNKHNHNEEYQTPWRGISRFILILIGLTLIAMAWLNGLFSLVATESVKTVEVTAVPSPTAVQVIVTPTPVLALADDLTAVQTQLDNTTVSLNEIATQVAFIQTNVNGHSVYLEQLQTGIDATNQAVRENTFNHEMLVYWLIGIGLFAFVVFVSYMAFRFAVLYRSQIGLSASPVATPLPQTSMTFLPPTRKERVSPLRLAGIIKIVWVEYPQHVSKSELFKRSYARLYPGRIPPSFGGHWFHLFNEAYTAFIDLSTTASTSPLVEVVEG